MTLPVVARPANVASAATRTLTAVPATDLDDEAVRLDWTGFTPTDLDAGSFTVTIFQCKASPRTMDDCYQVVRPPSGPALGTGIDNAVTNPDGTGHAFIELRPKAQLPELACSVAAPCSVIAFENDGQPYPEDGLPATAVVAPVTFARSPSDCPPVATPDVTTAGEGSAAHALYSWSSRMCTGLGRVALDYTETSSPASRRVFFENEVDVALTSARANAAEANGSARKSAYAYAPVDVSGVVISFNVTDAVTRERITDMNLTPRLVAMLIAGQQIAGPGSHLFDDPEFLALNPGHNWPASTQPPLLRAERNADAWVLTNWLQQDHAARAFLNGEDATAPVNEFWKNVVYPTDTFEVRDPGILTTYVPRTGTVINARRLFTFLGPSDGVSLSPMFDGVLGVLDAVTARKFGLPTAHLLPANAPAGTAFVAPDRAGLAAGYDAMAVQNGPGGQTRLANPTALSGAYPLVKVDYAMVPTKGMTTAKAHNIAKFLGYAAQSGQQTGALDSAYLALPASSSGQTKAVAEQLEKYKAPPTPTTTTAPSTTTTVPDAVPVDSSGDGGGSFGDDLSFSSGGGDDLVTASGVPPAGGGPTSGGRTKTPKASSGDGGVIARLAPVAFLGATNQFLFPIALLLGAICLVAGPLVTRRAKRRAVAEEKSSPDLDAIAPAQP